MEINDYGVIADWYDVYVPATFDIPFFVSEARQCAGEVLELMSGTGRVSIPLLEAGVRLTCVDLSAEMNAILRQKLAERGLKADVYQMDVCQLELSKQFGMVIIPFHSFAHIVSSADQRRALERIRRQLQPGGTFICTLGNPRLRGQAVDGRLRLFRKYDLADGQGMLLMWILENFNPEDEHVVETLEFFEEYDAKGGLKSKRMLELKFRLTSKEEFEELAEAAGFKVTAFYGDYDYATFDKDNSPFMIWILQAA